MVAVAMTGLMLLVTGGVYLQVTWARAEEVCALEAAEGRDGPGTADTRDTVAVEWSWSPVGIRCSWDEGTRTSLWWGTSGALTADVDAEVEAWPREASQRGG